MTAQANPWGLSPQESAVLTSLLKTGCNKLVARELGVLHRTVEVHLFNARRKMKAPNRVMGALMWERHLKDQRAGNKTERQDG